MKLSKEDFMKDIKLWKKIRVTTSITKDVYVIEIIEREK